jgi:hypothetical protein
MSRRYPLMVMADASISYLFHAVVPAAAEGRSLSAARWLSILCLTTAISSQVLHDFLARAVSRVHRLKLDSKALKGFVTRSG